jgi:undecaprenol kinase
MRMDLRGNKQKYRYTDTFKFAIEGIRTAFIQEKNIRFHIITSILVIIFASFFSLSQTEWMFILFLIAGMLTLEMINTAIENVVDLVTAQYHPIAKQAKDIAAGAVLVYGILSVTIGIIIFIPKIFSLF